MYQRILIPIDGSLTSEHALNEAIKFARSKKNVHIKIVHVLEEIWYFEDESYLNHSELVELRKSTGEKILAQAENKFQKASIATVTTELLKAQGERVATVIVAEAKKILADLIIIGTHGRSGVTRLLLGSVTEGVVRTADTPVLLIRLAEDN